MQVGSSNSHRGSAGHQRLSTGSATRLIDEPCSPVNMWDLLRGAGKASLQKSETASQEPGLLAAFDSLALRPDIATESSTLGAGGKEVQQSAGSGMEARDLTDGLRTRQSGEEPGEYFLAATLWPAKLGKGCGQLSNGLLSSLGSSGWEGRRLLIHKVAAFMSTMIGVYLKCTAMSVGN